ncbi:MAG: RNase adaptor protein RapZ, partial [Lachnospiraceae bacterium]|nr:RNase adaptor protein RapZ [Lachnospiraceae bacterium]
MKLVILTGMSGAGKSTAIKMMEDIGFYCVDNLPIPLLEIFVDLVSVQNAELQKVAVGIDIRSGQSLDQLQVILDHMQESDREFEIMFLDAEDSVLVKRYK